MSPVVARMILTILPVTLIAVSASAQTTRPAAPRRTQEAAEPQNIYVSTTLPSTGHATLFRRYAAATQPTPTLPKRRPVISPYLNLAPGSVAGNYFLGVQRDQQIFDTGTQVRDLNTQVGGLQQNLRGRRQPTAEPTRDSGDDYLSPLKRKSLEQRSELGTDAALVEQLRELRNAQDQSSQQQQKMFEAMLNELKAIREGLSPKKETADPEKSNP